MKIIKLSAIDSTNTYLKKLGKRKFLEDGTIVLSDTQTAGRGQMGAHWQSKTGQSLTFSIFKRFKQLDVIHRSRINFGVSLGIKLALEKLQVPGISIKWPNDIMSYQQKLCGILIENRLERDFIESSVIGIGLNVNETEFKNLPQATSMKLTSGIIFNRDEVLQSIATEVISQLENIENTTAEIIKAEYEKGLFRKNIITVFQDERGSQFNGMIRGVSTSGELLVEEEDEVVRSYEIKKITMLY